MDYQSMLFDGAFAYLCVQSALSDADKGRLGDEDLMLAFYYGSGGGKTTFMSGSVSGWYQALVVASGGSICQFNKQRVYKGDIKEALKRAEKYNSSCQQVDDAGTIYSKFTKEFSSEVLTHINASLTTLIPKDVGLSEDNYLVASPDGGKTYYEVNGITIGSTIIISPVFATDKISAAVFYGVICHELTHAYDNFMGYCIDNESYNYSESACRDIQDAVYEKYGYGGSLSDLKNAKPISTYPDKYKYMELWNKLKK